MRLSEEQIRFLDGVWGQPLCEMRRVSVHEVLLGPQRALE
jgi:hypothetical protein